MNKHHVVISMRTVAHVVEWKTHQFKSQQPS
jgi:hypothetical protein